jgi:nicotinate-nucleotide pyrophosphorylase (carboxylating)
MTVDVDPNSQADIQPLVARALAEDIGSGDLTAALIPEDRQASASVVARSATVLCGSPWFDETFHQLDAQTAVRWLSSEGSVVQAGQCVCTLTGSARALLSGERTGLNFLQTLSGTAAMARRYAQAVAHLESTILDTRKTIPGLRLAQKHAVRVGGASNHRIGLFDAVLIKENHIAAAGSIEVAVTRASEHVSPGTMIEIEVETLAELEDALRTSATRIMLDNFDLDAMRDAVERRNALAPHIELEASGGITFENVRAIAETGVDVISVGAMTKDLAAADFSMRFD